MTEEKEAKTMPSESHRKLEKRVLLPSLGLVPDSYLSLRSRFFLFLYALIEVLFFF